MALYAKNRGYTILEINTDANDNIIQYIHMSGLSGPAPPRRTEPEEFGSGWLGLAGLAGDV